ncbi:chaplin [Streptomyces sp. NPDC000348]|uniref:chaplin n=1 Tax=Streptomyces sp. NPDC000348 TaxID=3364538 RepID=UPI0036C825A6
MIAVAAASGAMAVAAPAYAGAGAEGVAAGSPGVGSGNTLQLPAHVPVNVCGNTVNVVGLLNPAVGNTCVNEDTAGQQADSSASSASSAGAAAGSGTHDSPGVVSGNGVQLPVHVPVNVSGNSVNVVGAGNASAGNTSTNTSGERPGRPARPAPAAPPRTLPDPAPHADPPHTAALADTGADRTLPVLGAGAALFLGGVALYRRARLRTYG